MHGNDSRYGISYDHENIPDNFDPLGLHFYIVKLWVHIIFLISAQNIDCGYSLEPPRRGGSNEYPQSVFEQKYENYQIFFYLKFSFFGCKIFNIFEYACFHNEYSEDVSHRCPPEDVKDP